MELAAFLIAATNIIIVLSGLVYFANLFFGLKLWVKLHNFYKTNSLSLSTLTAIFSTVGSLFFSQVLKLPPCELCWYQRIFMYPMAFIFLTSVFGKAKDVFKYTVPLSILGLFVSGYHYNLQFNPNAFAPCSSIGFSISCTEKFTTYYGYITIPWMALTAFAVILGMALINLGYFKPKTR